MERRCSNCGAVLGPNDTFCGECGAPVARAGYVPPNSQPMPPPPYQQPIIPSYPPVYPPPAQAKKSSGSTLVIVAAVVVLLAVVGGGGWLLLGNKGSGGSGTPTPTANQTTPAALTPTSGAVAIKPFTRGQIRKITNNTDPNTYYAYPSWSSTGKQLAFVVGQGSQYEQHIYTVPTSGGEPKQLTSGTGLQDIRPTWLGDAYVFFGRGSKDSAGNQSYRLYYINSNGGPAGQLITDTYNTNQYAMVDSNEDPIAVAEDSSGNLHVYALDGLPATSLHDIGDIQSTFDYLSSSSSDRYYLFSRSPETDTSTLVMFDSTNGKATQLTNTGGNDTVPTWRAGDRLIAFSHADKGSKTYRLYAITIDENGKPSQPFRLLNDTEGTYELEAVWSPVTNQVAFVSDREGGASNLYVMDIAPVNDAAGWLGVSTVMLSNATIKADKLPVSGGAQVRAIADGSPASNAGIQQDDVIISVDGTPIDDFHPLAYLMLNHQPGDSVSLQVYQKMSGQTSTLSIKTAARPANQLADR